MKDILHRQVEELFVSRQKCEELLQLAQQNLKRMCGKNKGLQSAMRNVQEQLSQLTDAYNQLQSSHEYQLFLTNTKMDALQVINLNFDGDQRMRILIFKHK